MGGGLGAAATAVILFGSSCAPRPRQQVDRFTTSRSCPVSFRSLPTLHQDIKNTSLVSVETEFNSRLKCLYGHFHEKSFRRVIRSTFRYTRVDKFGLSQSTESVELPSKSKYHSVRCKASIHILDRSEAFDNIIQEVSTNSQNVIFAKLVVE
jgi:hypothetical protein